jgi:hypothetical protein
LGPNPADPHRNDRPLAMPGWPSCPEIDPIAGTP